MDALVSAPAGEWSRGPAGAGDGDADSLTGVPPEPASTGASGGVGDDTFAAPWFTARERALLDYADRVTLAPASVTAEHIEALRAAGFDDRAIHDACSIVAYFAFVNRVADGLGVELEDDDRAWRDGGDRRDRSGPAGP